MKNPVTNDDAGKNYRHHRFLVRLGQIIMAVGLVVGLSHWIAHVVTTGGPPGIQDLFIGYPTAAVLMIAGAILAGHTAPKRS